MRNEWEKLTHRESSLCNSGDVAVCFRICLSPWAFPSWFIPLCHTFLYEYVIWSVLLQICLRTTMEGSRVSRVRFCPLHVHRCVHLSVHAFCCVAVCVLVWGFCTLRFRVEETLIPCFKQSELARKGGRGGMKRRPLFSL